MATTPALICLSSTRHLAAQRVVTPVTKNIKTNTMGSPRKPHGGIVEAHHEIAMKAPWKHRGSIMDHGLPRDCHGHTMLPLGAPWDHEITM